MVAGAVRGRWMSVNNVMTKDVVTIKASAKVKDAWITLMEKGISGAPVVDDSGALVGILSVTDIFRVIVDRVAKARSLRSVTMQFPDKDSEEKEEVRELSLAIRAVAEGTVVSVLPKGQVLFSLKPEDSLERGVKMIAENGVNRLPVVKDGKVIGIITRQDIIEVIAGVSRKAQD